MRAHEFLSETAEENQIINIIATTIAKKLVDREMFNYNAGKIQFNATDLRLPKINDPVMSKLLDTLKFVVLPDNDDDHTLGQYLLGGDRITLFWSTLKKKAGDNKERLKVQVADTLSHELQHALDAYKGGRKPFSDIDKPLPNPKVGMGNKENRKAYLKQRHEVNARLQQALYDIYRGINQPGGRVGVTLKDLPRFIEWGFKRNELDNLYWKDQRAYKRLLTRAYKYLEAEINNPKKATPTPGLIQRAIAFITGDPTTEIK